MILATANSASRLGMSTKCADLVLISGPSPETGAADCLDTYFWIQTLAVAADRLSSANPTVILPEVLRAVSIGSFKE